jgi:myoferlin
VQATPNLFLQRHVRGWVPFFRGVGKEKRISGKMDCTIELLTKEEAEDRPAGRARDDPNSNPTLDPPRTFVCDGVMVCE